MGAGFRTVNPSIRLQRTIDSERSADPDLNIEFGRIHDWRQHVSLVPLQDPDIDLFFSLQLISGSGAAERECKLQLPPYYDPRYDNGKWIIPTAPAGTPPKKVDDNEVNFSEIVPDCDICDVGKS